MSDFQTHDPTAPAFWTERFARNFTPWDQGGVPSSFQEFVAAARPMTTLIPGCGSAYEVMTLSEAGWDVTAIDFSPAAVSAAKAHLGRWAGRVQQADFFDFVPAKPLDLIYERAFMCALPPEKWSQVAARWAALLPPGGLLAGFFFLDDMPKGPPFGIAPDRLNALLSPFFELVEQKPVIDSIPVFRGKESWQMWRRRHD